MGNVRISIASARVNAGMNQLEFAKEMGVSVSTVANWEKGKTEPSASEVRKISELSGIPIDFIFVQCES